MCHFHVGLADVDDERVGRPIKSCGACNEPAVGVEPGRIKKLDDGKLYAHDKIAKKWKSCQSEGLKIPQSKKWDRESNQYRNSR